MPEKFPLASELMNFIFAVAVAIIAAFIFYIFQIYLPQRKKRKMLKGNLEQDYFHFKRSALLIFFDAMKQPLDTWTKLSEELLDLGKCRAFFEKRDEDGKQSNWDRVFDGLHGQLLKDLLKMMGVLMDEVSYILNNLEIKDKDAFLYFKALAGTTYDLRDVYDGAGFHDSKKRFLKIYLRGLLLGREKEDKEDRFLFMMKYI
ncbi:MAG: hypothetical protein ABIH35_04890 [Patescibacteria group bacterium]